MNATKDQEPPLVPPWLAWTFWIAYILHAICSAALRGRFADARGSTWGIIRFLVLSLSYAALGATLHGACRIPNPSIIYSRVVGGMMLQDVAGTVGMVIKESIIAALLIWLIVSFLAIGSELHWSSGCVTTHFSIFSRTMCLRLPQQYRVYSPSTKGVGRWSCRSPAWPVPAPRCLVNRRR